MLMEEKIINREADLIAQNVPNQRRTQSYVAVGWMYILGY